MRESVRDCPYGTRCFFYGVTSHTCDYYLTTGVRRGCEVGAACKRYLPRGDRRKRGADILLDGSRPPRKRSRKLKLDETAALALWESGMNDREIAEALRVSAGCIRRWRYRSGRVSNWVRRKKRSGNE